MHSKNNFKIPIPTNVRAGYVQAGPGVSGPGRAARVARGRGSLISPRVAGRGARVGDHPRPCEPCFGPRGAEGTAGPRPGHGRARVGRGGEIGLRLKAPSSPFPSGFQPARQPPCPPINEPFMRSSASSSPFAAGLKAHTRTTRAPVKASRGNVAAAPGSPPP